MRGRARGLPVTSPARTLLDLAGVIGRRPLERAAEQAYVHGRFDPDEITALLAMHGRGRRGAAALRALVADRTTGTTLTRNEFEERFLRWCARHRLPRPNCNQRLRVGDRFVEVDALWPAQGVGVELDGRRFHSSLPAQRRDAVRDTALLATGVRPVHLVWSQIATDDPVALAVLRRLLYPQPDVPRGR